MSETFLIIDMMLGSKGLSSTYEQAHVDLDLFDPGIINMTFRIFTGGFG